MADFLCLIRGGDARMANLSEGESKAHMAEWHAYMGKLAADGNLKGGTAISLDSAAVVSADKVENGAHTDGGRVGGYLLLTADNLDQAVALTKSCPTISIGGSVEVRESIAM